MEIDITKFGDLEFVKNMFKDLNCIGNTNCFLVALNRNFVPSKYQNNPGMGVAGAKVGGIAGGIIGSAMTEALNNMEQEILNSIQNPGIRMLCDKNMYGYVINVTEYGIGFVPLTNNSLSISKAVAHPESFTYITYNFFKSTKLKKIPFNFGRRILYITWNEEKNPQSVLTFRMKDKAIGYQEQSFKEFVKIYETFKKED